MIHLEVIKTVCTNFLYLSCTHHLGVNTKFRVSFLTHLPLTVFKMPRRANDIALFLPKFAKVFLFPSFISPCIELPDLPLCSPGQHLNSLSPALCKTAGHAFAHCPLLRPAGVSNFTQLLTPALLLLTDYNPA